MVKTSVIYSSESRVPLCCFYHRDLLLNRRILFVKGISKRDIY